MKRDFFESEHEEFRTAVRQFVARELAPHASIHREQKGIGRGPWRAAGEQGFLGFMMPERFGGGGINDFRFNAVFGEELATLAYGYASAFGLNLDVMSPYLLDFTNEEQKHRWIPKFCTGELIVALAMTEPGAGSDVAALTTNAKRRNGGWVLNGSKIFITNGAVADLVIVAATTDSVKKARGLTLFAVEAQTPGFARGKKLDKVGQPEVDATELFLDDVEVSDANVIGDVDAGFGYMMKGLAQERLSVAIAAVADGYAVFEETLRYVKERSAFGQAIGSFQHSRFQMATMWTELDVARSYVDACLKSHVFGELDGVTAAKAKYVATETENRVLDGCVQLFGGYGYMKEYRVARAWMDGRVTRIFAGTNEIMREVIGRGLGL